MPSRSDPDSHAERGRCRSGVSMSADIIRVCDTTTRAELTEMLGHLCAHAKRQQYVIETFADDVPTAWTKAHRQINAILDDLQSAPA